MEFVMDLKEYIRQDFYRSNIDKYRKYFEEWYKNLTETQGKTYGRTNLLIYGAEIFR